MNIIYTCKAIFADLRGYNLSDKPKGMRKYSLKYLIADIAVSNDKLNSGKKFYLAGHDWGGAISWVLAEKYPELVKKLIILNAPHLIIFQQKLKTDKNQQRANFYIFEFLKPKGEQLVLLNDFAMLKEVVFEWANKEYSEFDKQKYVEAWSQAGAITAGVNYYRANLDFKDLTGIIKVPTLVIWGMKDKALLPQVLDGLEDYVEDLKIVRSNDSSHWVMHDDPELVISSIKDFLK